MIDKIKVNLSYYVYNTLLQDMVRFECFKPNGDVNRNDFLNVVICNFYYNKIVKRNRIKELLEAEAILDDVSKKHKEMMLDSATKIMDDYYNEDLSYKYYHFYFMIYPTKETQNFFDNIYENEIKNKISISAFIRRLLNEYVYLPQYARENVVKRSEAIDLTTACKDNNIILFNVSNSTYKIAPYKLINNIEQTHSYILGLDLNSKDNKPISIKLSKITNIVFTKNKYKFSKDEHSLLNNIIFNGVEFASSEIITVKMKFTKTGIKLLKIKLHNRPFIKELDNDILEISCSVSNFINYFIPFGKEITILDNEQLKDKLFNFYKVAMEHHQAF